MIRRHIVIGYLVLVAALLLIWLWSRSKPNPLDDTATSSAPSSSPAAQTATGQSSQPVSSTATIQREQEQLEMRKQVLDKVTASLNTPIAFYGKVVDQYGKPVPNVRVGYGLLDKFNASGSNGHKFADETGYFEISGVKGAVIGVNVSKEGYYQIHNVSNQSFAYGIGTDGSTKPPPTKDNPAVFVLQKMGETVPLVRVETGGVQVPKNGTPVNFSLLSGRVSGKQALRVETWTFNEGLDPNLNQPYDWRCRVSVPGGGLVERNDQFAFEAPETGYREFDEVAFKKTDSPWRHRFNKEYFAKLPDGTYARFKFWFTTGGSHFFEVESYLNPTPGSRNLEYDPAKRIK